MCSLRFEASGGRDSCQPRTSAQHGRCQGPDRATAGNLSGAPARRNGDGQGSVPGLRSRARALARARPSHVPLRGRNNRCPTLHTTGGRHADSGQHVSRSSTDCYGITGRCPRTGLPLAIWWPNGHLCVLRSKPHRAAPASRFRWGSRSSISALLPRQRGGLLRDGEIVAAAQEERFTRKKGDAVSPHAVEFCLARRHRRRRTSTTGRLLRQAAAQVRADPRDLPRRGAARLRSVPEGRPALDEGEAHTPQIRDGALEGYEGQAALRRAPRVARRQRVLPVAVRGGGHPDDGRRGRVGDDLHRGGRGNEIELLQGAALAALARAALLGVHLLHRASRSTPASTR
jgi:hypothetical protein